MFLKKKKINEEKYKREEIKNYNKEITLCNKKIKSIEKLKKLDEDEKKRLIICEENKIKIINSKIDNLSSEIYKKSNIYVEEVIIEDKIDIKYNILKEEDNSISNIIHIADIHIRLNLYHNEYRKVFNRLYESLNRLEEKNVLIVMNINFYMRVKLRS